VARMSEPPYQIRDEVAREAIARACLRGQSDGREAIAAEIRAGLVLDADGHPHSYWHCLATVQPLLPKGRKGQWLAAPRTSDHPPHWYWQDWGRL
jgi:hypothetical protein